MKIISNNIYYGFNKYDNATTNKINEKFERIKDPKNDIKFDINKNNKVEKSDKEENINIQNNLRINKFFLPTMNIIYDINFNFKEKTIKDILKLDLSNKYRLFGRDGNRKLLEEIELLSPTLTDLFQMNSLKLFKYYYNEEKPLNKIKFENKEIYLSPGTKSFF